MVSSEEKREVGKLVRHVLFSGLFFLRRYGVVLSSSDKVS
jgi:hypothetical protein